MKNITNNVERRRKPARKSMRARCLTVGLLVFSLMMNTGLYIAPIESDVQSDPVYERIEGYEYREESECNEDSEDNVVVQYLENEEEQDNDIANINISNYDEYNEYETIECDDVPLTSIPGTGIDITEGTPGVLSLESPFIAESGHEGLMMQQAYELVALGEGTDPITLSNATRTQHWTDGNTYVVPAGQHVIITGRQGIRGTTDPGPHGERGVSVSGNVTLVLEYGATLTITGGAGNVGTGGGGHSGGNGGHGLFLNENANLTIIGEGALNTNGGNGGNGTWGFFTIGGAGGAGGNGIHTLPGSTVRVGMNPEDNLEVSVSGGNGGNGATGTVGGRGGNGGHGIFNDGSFFSDGRIDSFGSGGGGGTGVFSPPWEDDGPGHNGQATAGDGYFNQARFIVTFVGWNNDDIPHIDRVFYGGDATPPQVPERQGYTFTGWEGSFTNVTSDRTVTAQFVRVGTVTFRIVGGTWIDGRDSEVSVPLTERQFIEQRHVPSNLAPKEGHEANGAWYPRDPLGWQMPRPVQGMMFTYTFPIKTYGIIFDIGERTDIDNGKQDNVPHGTPFNDLILPDWAVDSNADWTLTGWEVNGKPVDIATFQVTGSVTFTAQWERKFGFSVAENLDFGRIRLTSERLSGTPIFLRDGPFQDATAADELAVEFTRNAPVGWSLQLSATPPDGADEPQLLHQMIRIRGKQICVESGPVIVWEQEGNEHTPNITWESLKVAIVIPNNLGITAIVGEHQAELVWLAIPDQPK